MIVPCSSAPLWCCWRGRRAVQVSQGRESLTCERHALWHLSATPSLYAPCVPVMLSLLRCAPVILHVIPQSDLVLAHQQDVACRAENGSASALEVLQMTPCDLFSYLRGRTTWLVGDSMQQARLPAYCKVCISS